MSNRYATEQWKYAAQDRLQSAVDDGNPVAQYYLAAIKINPLHGYFNAESKPDLEEGFDLLRDIVHSETISSKDTKERSALRHNKKRAKETLREKLYRISIEDTCCQADSSVISAQDRLEFLREAAKLGHTGARSELVECFLDENRAELRYGRKVEYIFDSIPEDYDQQKAVGLSLLVQNYVEEGVKFAWQYESRHDPLIRAAMGEAYIKSAIKSCKRFGCIHKDDREKLNYGITNLNIALDQSSYEACAAVKTALNNIFSFCDEEFRKEKTGKRKESSLVVLKAIKNEELQPLRRKLQQVLENIDFGDAPSPTK